MAIAGEAFITKQGSTSQGKGLDGPSRILHLLIIHHTRHRTARYGCIVNQRSTHHSNHITTTRMWIDYCELHVYHQHSYWCLSWSLEMHPLSAKNSLKIFAMWYNMHINQNQKLTSSGLRYERYRIKEDNVITLYMFRSFILKDKSMLHQTLVMARKASYGEPISL